MTVEHVTCRTEADWAQVGEVGASCSEIGTIGASVLLGCASMARKEAARETPIGYQRATAEPAETNAK